MPERSPSDPSSIEDTRNELVFSVNDLRTKVSEPAQLAPPARGEPPGLR